MRFIIKEDKEIFRNSLNSINNGLYLELENIAKKQKKKVQKPGFKKSQLSPIPLNEEMGDKLNETPQKVKFNLSYHHVQILTIALLAKHIYAFFDCKNLISYHS